MSSEFVGLHFATPQWLWALLAVLPVWVWQFFKPYRLGQKALSRYADAKLLPHLLGRTEADQKVRRRQLAGWSLLWCLGVLAMAGPRWDFASVSLFRPGLDLVVLMDISRSMAAQDVVPSRLGRARQEIEDLLAQDASLRIGLIAFATLAQVVAPITEDRETLARVLPELDTDLVKLQGSSLARAFDRAERLLSGQSADLGRALLLVTDGDFDETDLEQRARDLMAKGIRLHILGVGSPEGGRVPMADGRWLAEPGGGAVISALNEELLRDLASAGGGLYQRATYRDDDVGAIVSELLAQAPVHQAQDREMRIWREQYGWLVGLLLLLLLPWFRLNRPQQANLGTSKGMGR
jgi:Ca-activated chloride channel family protein